LDDEDYMEHSGERRDKRKWQVTKEIPLSLIWSVLLLVAGGLMGYQSLKDKVEGQADETTRLTAALKDTNAALRDLTKEFQLGSGPSAQNVLRIQNLESSQTELRTRLTEMERGAVAREARILRLEVGMTNTNARVRAQGER
jgi:hypothetical protein